MGTRTQFILMTALLALIGWAASNNSISRSSARGPQPAVQTSLPAPAVPATPIATFDGGSDPEGGRWVDVCVVPGDSHYHRGNCKLVAGHGTLTTLTDARDDGLTPCPVCMPVDPRIASR